MRSRRNAGFLALLAGALVAGVLLALTGVAGARTADKPGEGKGRAKVTLCHKGHTIRVGAPAVPAHLRHGDTLGHCGAAAPARGTATLTVIKHVVNDNGGTKSASDFTLTINGVSASGPSSFAGSETGVTKTITSFGAYSVSETLPAGYERIGVWPTCSGTIQPGQHKTCVITNSDVPATLTVIKHVVNNNGRTKTAADFTITISGVTVAGGNSFAGSEAGVTKTLTSLGDYSVGESSPVGYVLTGTSADCFGTIVLGQHRTCTLTNDDLP
jgi:Prealbumin-like fold domain